MQLTKWTISIIAMMLLLTACQGEAGQDRTGDTDSNVTEIGFSGNNGNDTGQTNQNQADRNQSDNRSDGALRFPYEEEEGVNNRGDNNGWKPFNFFDRERDPDPGQNQDNGQNTSDQNDTQRPTDNQGNTNDNQSGQNDGQTGNTNQGQTNETGDVTTNQSIVDQVIQLTNEKREENGLSPVKFDEELTDVAQRKSVDMADQNYFSHQSPTYGSPFDMLDQFGVSYTGAAENIAAGQPTPEQVVTNWMNSEGHRKNILNDSWTHIGIGYEDSGRMNPYWTQMFITK
ncbi:putative YkwD family protein [Alkalibacillus flavidus]|uniref:YkwD family protein n=1 Tax=Alkalibacillus flavidus TaxID=546021 RepID=A0ABV2KQT0_9BACI